MLLSAVPGSAQVLSGSLTGSVLDPQELGVPRAKVTVVDHATGRQYTATTDETGVFTVTSLEKGDYRVIVEAPSFARFTIDKVQVNVAQTAKVVVKLELAGAGTEVLVTADQAVIDTESAELKSSVDRRQIIELPLPTRNPLDLVRTMPGVVTPSSSGIADAFVHGLRGNSTNITQDGINVADNFVKTSSFFAISAPTVDTVGEFNVSIGGIGVDSGFGAAQVNIVTQRGQNDFHGSAYWFQRTRVLNANTWFNNASGVPRPFQLQNRIGVNAGGPVYLPKLFNGKNRFWVFGNYEAFREPLARSRTRVVLSDPARTGSFTYNTTCGTTGQPACPVGVTSGQAITVNLLNFGTAGQPAGQPAVINSTVMNFYNSLVPGANTDAGCGSGDTRNIRCFTFNLPGSNKQDRYTLRADYQLTKNHSVEFIYNRANFASIPDLLNGIEPIFPKSPGGGQSSIREVYSWGLNSLFGNKTNEVRAGYQHAPVHFDLFNDFAATGGFQLTAPSVIPGVIRGLLDDPTLTSGNLPQGRNTPVRQVSDNFAWVKGRHTLRFGGEYRQILANSFFFNTVVPRVFLGQNTASNPDGLSAGTFSGPTGPGAISSGDLNRAQTVFDMITGLLNSVSQGFNHTSATSGFVTGKPRVINPIQHNFSGYFQDSFKWKPNFTLTAGVRYEYQGMYHDRTNLVLLPQSGETGFWGPTPVGKLFQPQTTPVATDTLLNFAGGSSGIPIYNPDTKNFAPFLGFAWDPTKNGRTSIRAGATMHYTQDGFTLFQNVSTGNTGLFSVLSNNTPTGTLNLSSVPTPSVPADVFPVSQRTNMIKNTGSALWFFKPNLSTPYVMEWDLSVSREVWKKISVEARYVGNHAVHLYRSYSINELNLLNNPYTCPASLSAQCGTASVANLLTEFQNAQANLACNGNSFAPTAKPCDVPLPILTALFGSATSSFFSNSGLVTNVSRGEIGALFDTLRRSNTFRTNREANFPLDFFVANPFANAANMVDNSSWSYYHGFEFEVRRRFTSGVFFQANYTFSKVLTDTRFLTNQTENNNYLTLANRSLDKFRAAFDITHSVSANFIYALPFGKGHEFGRNASVIVDKVIGGWQVQGLTRLNSGAPFDLRSSTNGNGRLTTGSLNGTTPVLRNMTMAQFQQFVGVFETPNGVLWLNPVSGLITVNGSKTTAVLCASPTQTTPCFDRPAAGQFGNMQYNALSGPKFVNQDLSIIKRTNVTKISEQFNFELRFEFFNAFNHPNFTGITSGLDDNTFGQLTSIVDTVRGGGVNSRIIQWAFRLNW